MLGLARGRLKQKCADLGASLEGDLSARHLFVLGHIQAHIETLRCGLTEIDAYLLAAMQPCAWAQASSGSDGGVMRWPRPVLLGRARKNTLRVASVPGSPGFQAAAPAA